MVTQLSDNNIIAGMERAHRTVLRKLRLEMSNQLLVSDTIVPFLYQEDILTDAQVQEIENQVTDRQKNLKLLEILPNRGPRAFHTFLRALQDFSWIRDRLLLELQAAPGPGSTNDCWIPDSDLQRVPSDRELCQIASQLGTEWEAVLMDLGLSAEAVFRCRSDHSLSTHSAVLAGLVQWRRAGGKKATLDRLQQSLQNAGVHPSVLQIALT